MTPKNIELHIEELVLHGFASGDRYRIADAVERELAALVTYRGLPQVLNREMKSLDGGAFEAVKGSRPEAIGARVAKAVYRGLNR